jgi:hypothetical protein
MNRLISQGQAIRSTRAFSRVTHFIVNPLSHSPRSRGRRVTMASRAILCRSSKREDDQPLGGAGRDQERLGRLEPREDDQRREGDRRRADDRHLDLTSTIARRASPKQCCSTAVLGRVTPLRGIAASPTVAPVAARV